MSMARIATLVLGISLCSNTLSAQGEVYGLAGKQNTTMGRDVACVGDIDGDGVADIAACGLPVDYSKQSLIRVWSGKTGILLLSIDSSPPFGGPGYKRIVAAGDVDADGVPDLLAANNQWTNPQGGGIGAVWVYSGATGLPLHSIYGSADVNYVGSGIGTLGDVDGDGADDFVYAAPGEKECPTCDMTGVIHAISGATGQELYSVHADSFGSAGASDLTPLNDLDGDGVRDFVVNCATLPFYDMWFLRWVSGATGATLLVEYIAPGNSGNAPLDSIGDLDGDGLEDVLVGMESGGPCGAHGGNVTVYSSADASQLLFYADCDEFGFDVAGIGDFNADGVPDFVASAAPYLANIKVISGKDATLLYERREEQYSTYFGYSLAGLGDLNGDGRADFAVGWPLDNSLTGQNFSGSVRVILGGTSDPTVYCSAKPNSLGCTPSMDSTGLLSLSIADGIAVTASNLTSGQLGMLLWSRSSNALPFAGGMLCLGGPIQRLAPQQTGGTSNPPTCSGKLSYGLGQALAQQKNWKVGDRIFVQAWYRDPLHADGTGVGLSDALRFTVIH